MAASERPLPIDGHWSARARGTLAGDWLTPGCLALTDPYLVWLDVTGFRGAALDPAQSAARTPLLPPATLQLPTLQETDDPQRPFCTRRVAIGATPGTAAAAAAAALAQPQPRRTPLRFEVAAAFVGDTDADGQVLPPPWLPASGAQGQRRAAQPRPLVGFIDFGCAFAHRHFRCTRDGRVSTRVLALWDQSVPQPPQVALAAQRAIQPLQWGRPADFGYGAETHREQHWGSTGTLTLDDYLQQFQHGQQLDEAALYRHSGYTALRDTPASHGTHVMDLATGWPDPLQPLQPAADTAAAKPHDVDIVFVQLPQQRQRREISGLLRAHVFDGIDYILSCAHEGQPVVINLSYGGNAGPHDGTSVLERAIDWRLQLARESLRAPVTLVLPAGNAHTTRLHASADIATGQTARFAWNNAPDDPSDSFVELWLPLEGDFHVQVTPPAGLDASTALGPGQAGTWERGGRVVAALVFASAVCQSDRGRMVLLAVGRTRPSADGGAAPYGTWEITVTASALAAPVRLHAWCERDEPPFGSAAVPRQGWLNTTGSSRVDSDGTLNSIAHGRQTLVVGAHVLGGGASPYSATGPGRGLPGRHRHGAPKSGAALRGPQQLAPGDESSAVPGLLAAAIYGSDCVRLAGTSMAAARATRRLLDQLGGGAGVGGLSARGLPRTTTSPPPSPSPTPSPPAVRPLRVPSHPDDDLAPN